MRRTLLALVGVALLAALAAPVAAQSTATTTPTPTAGPTQTAPGYYDNSSGSVDSGGWLSGMTDASLEDIVALSVRVGPFIIGTGSTAGAAGSAGVLLTGALVAAIVTSTGIRARVGPVGGAVFALATTFVLFSVQIGPEWLYALVLFAFGLAGTTVLVRSLR